MECKWSHVAKEIILWGLRGYVAYPISYRQLEEMMREREVAVDHSILNRWVVKYAPEVEQHFRRTQFAKGNWSPAKQQTPAECFYTVAE
jgi:putative transposase